MAMGNPQEQPSQTSMAAPGQSATYMTPQYGGDQEQPPRLPPQYAPAAAPPQPAVAGKGGKSLIVPGVKMGLMLLSTLFCFLAFVIMASVMVTMKNYSSLHRLSITDEANILYKEFPMSCSYVIAVGVIGFVYSLIQVFFSCIDLTMKKSLVTEPIGPIIDFVSSLIMAFLLMSASSAAAAISTIKKHLPSAPVTDEYNGVLDRFAASLSMGIFAFLALAICAIFFGFRVSMTRQTQ